MRISLLVTLSVLTLGMAAPAYALSPVACTMDAKLCPDGVTYVGRDGNRNCQWQLCPKEKDTCAPYACNDGTSVNKCAQDGTVINYFAPPCLTHGGEVDSLQSFSDVPASHQNAEAIAYLKANKIVEGYADGTFKPDATINRAEFTKIVIATHVDQAEIDDCPLHGDIASLFSDTPQNAWYLGVLCVAHLRDIIAGYPDGTFRPAATINFVEAAKILSKTFGRFDTTESQTSLWYEAYVQDLAQRSAIPLSISRFDQQITRGEMAEMMWRLKTGNVTKASSTYDVLEINTSTEAQGSALSEDVDNLVWKNDALGYQFSYPKSVTVDYSEYTPDGACTFVHFKTANGGGVLISFIDSKALHAYPDPFWFFCSRTDAPFGMRTSEKVHTQALGKEIPLHCFTDYYHGGKYSETPSNAVIQKHCSYTLMRETSKDGYQRSIDGAYTISANYDKTLPIADVEQASTVARTIISSFSITKPFLDK